MYTPADRVSNAKCAEAHPAFGLYTVLRLCQCCMGGGRFSRGEHLLNPFVVVSQRHREESEVMWGLY